PSSLFSLLLLLHAPTTTAISTLSLHDALPISFFVAFPRATDAVAAAVAAQRSLATAEWPEDAEVRVRMGLHTGEPTVGGERYVRSEEHTSELQSLAYLVCRLLLEKKKITMTTP